MLRKIAFICALAPLYACDGGPVSGSSGAQSSRVASQTASSSNGPVASQSSSVAAINSSHSSVPVSSASQQSSVAQTFTLQENAVGFCFTDGDSAESSNPGFTGGGYVNTDNFLGAQVVWAVNVSESRTFTLEIRFANGGETNRDGELVINAGAGGAHNIAFVSTNSWDNWQTLTVDVDLVAGNNLLALAALTSDGLANIDAITFTGGEVSGGDCTVVQTSSSSTASSQSSGDYPILSQDGNPAQNRYQSSRYEWSQNQAEIILSHQYDNGGWPKNQDYASEGSGGSGRGTIDNGATVTEMVYLAQVYHDTGRVQYRDAVRKAMQFIFEAQYDSGAWPQFYPLRGGYSDHATFNDNAMASVLTVLHNAHQQNAPFNGDIFSDSDRQQMKQAVDKGVDYILKAQWQQNGILTVWCAQHGAYDYQPKAGRAYELESLSGSESVEILGFLMTQPQTPEITAAVKAGIAWFKSPATYLADYTYDKGVEEKIVPKAGSRMWYRFYDLSSNAGFFSDRDGGKYYDLMEISEERRNGYSWGGNYGEKIISYANKVGY
ncbi:MAG TPA: pectate lyase [Marinagarivorans sp.]